MSRNFYEHIDDNDLINEVSTILNTTHNAREEINESFESNVIDPFSALLEASARNITHQEWVNDEKTRQLQKTFQNTVGYFHEHIIGYMNGWSNPVGGGYDVEHSERKIIGEIKNKHNTMNASSAEAVYTKMAEFLDSSKAGYTAYVVTIIPRRPERFNHTFCPSVRGVPLPEREDIRIVDGATFYEIASGDPRALQKLYSAIPKVVKHVSEMSDDDYKPEIDLFEAMYTKAFN